MAVVFQLVLLLLQFGASSCRWTSGTEIGEVHPPLVEDSGLAVSRRFSDRVYHVNDSGDSGRFFITDFTGDNMQIVNVNGFQPLDAEDLAVGPCGPRTDCLFIGDIGDNFEFRRLIELVAIEERKTFPSEVDPRFRVLLRYPDGPHNAESLAVHSDGTIYILTKNHHAQLFRLPKEKWMNANGQAQTLEFAGTIDFDKLAGGFSPGGRVPTAIDISPDGRRMLILTYRDAFELLLDLSRPWPPIERWQEGQDYKRARLHSLDQQEGVAYLPDGQSFIYGSEMEYGGRAPIMKSICRN